MNKEGEIPRKLRVSLIFEARIMDFSTIESLGNTDLGLLPGLSNNPLMLGELPGNELLSVTKNNGVGSALDFDSTELLDRLERKRKEEDEKRQENLDNNLFDRFNSNAVQINPFNTGNFPIDNTPLSDKIEAERAPRLPQQVIYDSGTLRDRPSHSQQLNDEGDEITGIATDQPLANLSTPNVSSQELLFDLPEFPTAAVEAALDETNDSGITPSNPIAPIFELEGISVGNANMTLILDRDFLIDPNNPENQNFYIKSNDPIWGEREATLETGAATMDLVRFFLEVFMQKRVNFFSLKQISIFRGALARIYTIALTVTIALK